MDHESYQFPPAEPVNHMSDPPLKQRPLEAIIVTHVFSYNSCGALNNKILHFPSLKAKPSWKQNQAQKTKLLSFNY